MVMRSFPMPVNSPLPNKPWIPVGDWKKIFILFPRIVDGKKIYLRFAYRRKYERHYYLESNIKYKYHLSEFEILKHETN